MQKIILQEAWIRWQRTETVVQSPKAFLSQIVTRLCVDYLQSARVKREQYFRTWIPEPLTTKPVFEDGTELVESLTVSFLMLSNRRTRSSPFGTAETGNQLRFSNQYTVDRAISVLLE